MDKLLTPKYLVPSLLGLAVIAFLVPAQVSTALALMGTGCFVIATARWAFIYQRDWVSKGFAKSGLGMIGGMSGGFVLLAMMLIDRLVHGYATTFGVVCVALTPVAWFIGMVFHMRTRRPYDWSDGLIDALSALAAVVVLRWQWLALDHASLERMAIQLAPFVAVFFLGTVGSHNLRLERDPRQNKKMLRILGGCVPPLIIAFVLSDTMTKEHPTSFAFAFLLIHAYMAAAGSVHSSFLSQLEPEPGDKRMANPLRIVGPVAALLTTPLMVGLFVIRHAVPTIPVAVTCTAMIALALWRGAGLLKEREANRRQLADEQRFRTLVEHSHDIITILDENLRVVFATGGIKKMVGADANEIIGLHVSDFLNDADAEMFYRTLTELAPGETQRIDRDILLRNSDGSERWAATSLTNHLGTPGIGGYVVNTHDITDRKQAEAALSRMAHYDSLTGLPNRLYLFTKLEEQVHAQNLDQTTAVLFCDLDGFKAVNDTQGHEIGDEVLRQVAGRWSSELRASDSLGRWGGDEFVAICVTNGGREDVDALASRLERRLNEPIIINDKPVDIGVSIGVVLHRLAETTDELMRRADEAMYEAKRAKQSRRR